jgi:hypothetical protein
MTQRTQVVPVTRVEGRAKRYFKLLSCQPRLETLQRAEAGGAQL